MKPVVKIATLLVGILGGAAIGYFVAKSYINESEANEREYPITATQGLQLGLSTLGLYKQLTGISKKP